MRNLKINKNVFGLFFASLLFGCANIKAPPGWLPNPDDLQTDVYGSWLTVEYTSNTDESLAGEFIAINQDSIFIANDKFHALALSTIRSIRLEIYDSNSSAMGGLVLLGFLSTASNGFYSAFSAPIWLVGGSISAGIRSNEPIIRLPKKESNYVSDDSRFPQNPPPKIIEHEIKWDSISQFARFPQGLPPDINRQEIKMKVKKQSTSKQQPINQSRGGLRWEE